MSWHDIVWFQWHHTLVSMCFHCDLSLGLLLFWGTEKKCEISKWADVIRDSLSCSPSKPQWPEAAEHCLVVLDEPGFLVAGSVKRLHICFPGCYVPAAGSTSCNYSFLTWLQQGGKTAHFPNHMLFIHSYPFAVSNFSQPDNFASCSLWFWVCLISSF